MKQILLLILTAISFSQCTEFAASNGENKTITIMSDSSIIIVKLLEDGYDISTNGKSTLTGSIDSVDYYIQANNGEVNKTRILILGDKNQEKFKKLEAILGKYKLIRPTNK